MPVQYADPFRVLLECFQERWPERTVRVQFVDNDTLQPNPGFWARLARKIPVIRRLFPYRLGVTCWNEDGSAEVMVSCSLKLGVLGSLDILAHELAHAGVGFEHDHDEVWKEAYAWLFRSFCALGTRMQVVEPYPPDAEELVKLQDVGVLN